jgi:flavin reductase (DIM6/NTAB) family NADH-FMN oxidoreductase RutF
MVAVAANLNRPTAHATPAQAPREATEKTFREAMRELASGVCLLTSGSGDERSGLIATSVASLSADPATLLVCVDRASSSYRAVQSYREFAVSVLGADQREIADRFAGGSSLRGADRFRDWSWGVLPGGACYIAGSVAVFDCEAVERIESHAHAIVIGRVRRVLIGDGSGALVRWRGAYDQVGWSRDEIARAVGLSPCGARTD